jgi:IclR family KDG regulon transcriptional repressor
MTKKAKGNLSKRNKNKGTQSIDRALDILTCFNFSNPVWDAVGLSHKLGLTLPTVKRILKAFEAKEILIQNGKARDYALGLRVFELGALAFNRISLENQAKVVLIRLREETNENVHLATVVGDEMLYIKKLESSDIFEITSPVGLRRPLASGAMGKAILSTYPLPLLKAYLSAHGLNAYTPNSITDPKIYIEELAKVREQGFAIDREELIPGVCAVGAAITEGNGKAIGSIAVSFPSIRFDEAKVLDWAQWVRQAGRTISYRISLIKEG